MEKSDSPLNAGPSGAPPNSWLAQHRVRYEARMREIQASFQAHARRLHAGATAVAERSAVVDLLVQSAWTEVQGSPHPLAKGVALIAVGGYGRRELFPYSDVDLMVLLDTRVPEKTLKEPIRRLNQLLWDAGLRVSAMTRTLAECERFDPENVEFTLSLLDARGVAGDQALTGGLLAKSLPKLFSREHKKIAARLLEVTRHRHTKFGDTLFHLEPNIKECPGGLRDAHVCQWLLQLRPSVDADGIGKLQDETAFKEARDFLLLTRAFLHFRHGRDDNTLDWQAQDDAAMASLGTDRPNSEASVDAAYWMRLYFRHARMIERCVDQYLDAVKPVRPARLRSLAALAVGEKKEAPAGFEIRQNHIWFAGQQSGPEYEPETVLAVFAAMAASGVRLSGEAERRLEQALPVLSASLEDGPALWHRLRSILMGRYAGTALRSMHALGMLELIIPEFHGIDALVIRDAYHRYTVDEHTFVLIDTLHALAGATAAQSAGNDPLSIWAARFGQVFRDLPHPELLLLASLLHDTGKGHAAAGHAQESARMAALVLQRLELDAYETGLILDLIRDHLEMSATLRRDVFDQETIRGFAGRVPNPEALRMLALFTYADIKAVHPDALTPWKAENLWRLYNATATYLDRNVDDERVAAETSSEMSELLHRIHALLPNAREKVNHYLDGFPQRYLQTRMPEVVRTHIEMAWRLDDDRDAIELDFRYAPGVSELAVITHDRPMLFASIAGVLAAWGMNIVTADGFANSHGVVVDNFRFTDTFKTLELNPSERGRFVQSVRDVLAGKTNLELLLSSRRRGRKKAPKTKVESRVDFDDSASSHSTLLQVVALDSPGLLRSLSLTLAERACNIEVALVDTEGETAIDVFYITKDGTKLDKLQQRSLRKSLLEAIDSNLR